MCVEEKFICRTHCLGSLLWSSSCVMLPVSQVNGAEGIFPLPSRDPKNTLFWLPGATPFTLSYKWRIGGWNKVKFDPLLFFYNFLLLPLAIWTLFLLQILQSLIDTVFNSISYAGKELWSSAINCRILLLLLFF